MRINVTRSPRVRFKSRRFVFGCNLFCCVFNLVAALLSRQRDALGFYLPAAGVYALLSGIAWFLMWRNRPGRSVDLFGSGPSP